MFKRILFSLVLAVTLALSVVPIRAAAPYTVAIIIVDDFTGVDLSSVKVPTDQDTCAVNLEGQAFIGRGASAGAPLPTAHGDLVYAQLQDMVKTAKADAFI